MISHLSPFSAPPRPFTNPLWLVKGDHVVCTPHTHPGTKMAAESEWFPWSAKEMHWEVISPTGKPWTLKPHWLSGESGLKHVCSPTLLKHDKWYWQKTHLIDCCCYSYQHFKRSGLYFWYLKGRGGLLVSSFWCLTHFGPASLMETKKLCIALWESHSFSGWS